MNTRSQPNTLIIEQASYWAVLIDEGELSQRQHHELAQWLVESPTHVQEFLHACTLLDVLDDIDPNKNISVEGLLKKISTPDVEPISITSKPAPYAYEKPARIETKKRPTPMFWALAASLVLSVLALYQFTPAVLPLKQQTISHSVNYVTTLGEQRSITLSDGSIIYLNTLTNVDIDYTSQFRNIVLHNGEAIFKVAHNPDKPFRVWVNGTMFQALGTEFNVRSNKGNVELTVINGVVALTKNARKHQDASVSEESVRLDSNAEIEVPLGRPLIVSVGQQATVKEDGKITTLVNADVDKKTSWKAREMIFKNDSLEDVIYEFNRYNALQISIASEQLSKMSITGVFETNDPQSLLRFLESSGKAKIQRHGANSVTILAL